MDSSRKGDQIAIARAAVYRDAARVSRMLLVLLVIASLAAITLSTWFLILVLAFGMLLSVALTDVERYRPEVDPRSPAQRAAEEIALLLAGTTAAGRDGGLLRVVWVGVRREANGKAWRLRGRAVVVGTRQPAPIAIVFVLETAPANTLNWWASAAVMGPGEPVVRAMERLERE